ncbi:MAG: transglycosylase SLT domain-containing protein [Deltaproteobacteria bacterium]|nr:transglycosylase SLT domain-containing protein [Deltaproteobacteria bacterium]
MRRFFALLSVQLTLVLVCASSQTLANPLLHAPRSFSVASPEAFVASLPPLTDANELRAAVALTREGRAAQSVALLRQAKEKLPYLTDAVEYLLGQAHEAAGELAEAMAAYRRAEQAPDSIWVDRARERQGQVALAAGDHQLAIKLFRGLLHSFPDHPRRDELQLGLGLALLKKSPKEAAAALQQVWIEHPKSPSALRARRELDALRKGGLTFDPPTLAQYMTRARQLRRFKFYNEAAAEVEALEQIFPQSAKRIHQRLAYVYRKADQPQAVLRVLEQQAAGQKELSWDLRSKIADTLAWLGRLEEGVKLLDAVPKTNPSLRRRAELLALSLLARHAEHKRAYERLRALTAKTPRLFAAERTWLAYRAGDYETAVKGFDALAANAAQRPFARYWQGRAHQRAGQREQAEALYRLVLEDYPETYYAYVARSRLHEMRALKLKPAVCPVVPPPPKRDPVARLNRLIPLYDHLLPRLRRARTLFRAGLDAEARRELRVLTSELTWTLYRGRQQRFRVRPWVARLWYGKKVHLSYQLDARQRALLALPAEDREELLARLGETLLESGVDYFGWRLAPPDPDEARQNFPLAFASQVYLAAKRYAVDPNLIWSIMRTESAYRPDAISRVYAGGLMQIMPQTARRLAREARFKTFDPTDVFQPETNILMATHYLRALWTKFRGQLPLIAAAYNGGPHNVARWLDFRGKHSTMDEFVEEIPLRESRRYAKKIVRLMAAHEIINCNKDNRVVSNRLDTNYARYPSY